MVKVLRKQGIKVSYLVKENEGHGFMNQENKMEVYYRMEDFLNNCV